MKKTILKIAVVAVIILNCCLIPFVSGNLANAEMNALDEDTMTIVFASENTLDGEENLIPDDDGKITISVMIRKKSDGVTFTLKTRDKSAMASLGDYEEKSQDFHLVTNQYVATTQYFSIQTYQTDAANLIESGTNGNYGKTRVFEVVICDIKTDSGCNYVVKNKWGDSEEGKKSFDCRIQTQYDYEYSGKVGKDGYYFVDYLKGSSFSSIWLDRNNVYTQTPSGWIGVNVDNDTSYDFNKTFSRFISSEYIAKYRKEDWADVYYGGSANIYESGWCTVDTPAKLTLSDAAGNKIFYSEYYDPKSSGAPILFGETKYAYNNSSDYRYCLTNAAKTWLNNDTNGYSIINVDDPMYKHAYCYYTQKDYNFPTAGKVYKSNSDSLTLNITRDSTWKMVFQFIRIDSELYDTNPPKIKGMSFGEITSTDNKVMRVSIRFSEPVHLPTSLNKNNLIVTGYANNSASTPLEFVYAGGEGSDTLYFDCDLKDYENEVNYKNTLITSITFRGDKAFSSGCKNISDYAYNFNQSNNFASLSMDAIADPSSGYVTYSKNISIDLREPKVESKLYTGTGDNYLNVSKSHTVEIDVSNMTSTEAKLYYTWVKYDEVSNADTFTPTAYDNCETINPTHVRAVGDKLDGKYYLFYKACSQYGRETTGHYQYALIFDNTSIEICGFSFGNANAAVGSRDLELTFEGKVDDLSTIQMMYRQVGDSAAQTLNIYDSTNTVSLMPVPTYDESTNKSTATFNLNGSSLGMADGESKRFYFSFITTDKVNNQSVYEVAEPYLFDTSERCKVNVVIDGTKYEVYENINVDTDVTTINGTESTYSNSYLASGFELSFSMVDSSSNLSIGFIHKGNEDVTANVADYFDCTSGSGTFNMKYVSAKGGYFSIQLVSNDKATDVFTFYLVGEEDNVAGYCQTVNNKLVTNKLFTIEGIKYYWLSKNNTVATEENYNTLAKNLSLVFSSMDRARVYYRFMEMQDLTLLYLDSANAGTEAIIANLNNTGATTAYRKAKGETETAVAGQTWIRYKNSSWDQSSDSSEWVYYFYSKGKETTITTSFMSSNLQEAINSVVEKIVSKGNYFYLTSDSGLDSNYIPKIDESRICSRTSVSQTKTGTSFQTTLEYAGDNEIYAPYYYNSKEDVNYPIAVQQLTASDYTSFYYATHGGKEYEKLNVNGTFFLKDKISGTGIYDIIERDENGARKYSVYIDNTAPTLNIIYNNGGDNKSGEVNKSYVGAGLTLNTQAFSFQILDDDDEYAYVAVFTSGKKLLQTYLASELMNVSLSEGKYIIEVYDRSGNGYSFSLRVSTEDLEKSCSISNEKNNRIRFTCKYSKDDIYRFEIYLNNVLLTEYNKNSLDSNSGITLREGGNYRFYVEDIFGKKYEEEATLIREVPQVTWYYEKSNAFIKFNENDASQLGMTKTQLGSTSYLITSCGRVRFSYSNEYSFEVLSGKYETATASKIVTFSDLDNWQVKIYYTDFPDVFAIFTGKSDTSAPTISATTNRAKYSYADENDDALDEYISSISNPKAGMVINFPDVSFDLEDLSKEVISSGEIVSGSLVCISVSDLSGVSKWSYTYNGETAEYTKDLPENVYFSKVGKYFISATDMLGNTSSFSFEIGKSEYSSIVYDSYVSAASTKTNYGTSKLVAKLDGAGAFVFVVDGEYYKLTTDGTNIVRVVTKISKIDGSKIETEEEEETWKTVKNSSYTISAYTSKGSSYVEFYLNKDKENTVNIKIRVQSDESVDSKYAEVELSNKLSYMDYECGDQTGKLDNTLYINKNCTIKSNDEIVSFFVSYSAVDDFSDADYEVYIAKETQAYVCKKEGFYKIEAFNAYGNSSVVKVLYSKGIPVVSSVEYTDGEKNTYSNNYDKDLYSNYSISFTTYANVDSYAVTKDGKNYSPSTTETEDGISIKLTGNGDFVVKIIDKYGNVITKNAHINNSNLSYSDEWLSGFNEKALKKEDGYTNEQIFFNEEVLKDNVKCIVYNHEGVQTTVYNELSESIVGFKQIAIGQDGEGQYEVVFRDQYGNKTVKNIMYKSSSPLKISRITRSLEKQDYALTEEELLNGIWSNKQINFECTSSYYKFTVNSEKKDIPYTLEFPSDSERGKFTYTISYLDEYGFSYEFNCILYRTNIELDLSGMAVENGVTKDAVCVQFEQNYFAQISLNGEVLGEYNSGDKYLRDGNYVISVFDNAGNVSRYSIKRDSVVNFCLYTTTQDQPMTSGEITNKNLVYFAPLNGDTVSYCMVYHDGVLQEKYDSTTFTEGGKWELIIQDEIGNKDYFCFYMVTHSLISFDYTTPYGYTITEATYDGGGGKVDCVESAKTENDCSSFTFDQTGEYEIVMTSNLTGRTASFVINIDKTVPKIELQGVEAGQATKKNVKISGYKTGDTVYIYRDGKLAKEIKVVSSADVPEITEKGNYKIVIVNEAGGSSEVEFTRVYTANVATSSLIIVVIVAIVIGLFAGLLFRKRSRIE